MLQISYFSHFLSLGHVQRLCRTALSHLDLRGVHLVIDCLEKTHLVACDCTAHSSATVVPLLLVFIQLWCSQQTLSSSSEYCFSLISHLYNCDAVSKSLSSNWSFKCCCYSIPYNCPCFLEYYCSISYDCNMTRSSLSSILILVLVLESLHSGGLSQSRCKLHNIIVTTLQNCAVTTFTIMRQHVK